MSHFTAMMKKAAFATLCVAAAFNASASQAESMKSLQLKTSVQEVNGVREIERGDYLRGIAKSQAALQKTTIPALRAPILNNICVAQIALGDTEQAKVSCDAAVAASERNALAFNNRAILNYLQNDKKACVEDMQRAQALGQYNRIIQKNAKFIAQQDLLAKN